MSGPLPEAGTYATARPRAATAAAAGRGVRGARPVTGAQPASRPDAGHGTAAASGRAACAPSQDRALPPRAPGGTA